MLRAEPLKVPADRARWLACVRPGPLLSMLSLLPSVPLPAKAVGTDSPGDEGTVPGVGTGTGTFTASLQHAFVRACRSVCPIVKG